MSMREKYKIITCGSVNATGCTINIEKTTYSTSDALYDSSYFGYIEQCPKPFTCWAPYGYGTLSSVRTELLSTSW